MFNLFKEKKSPAAKVGIVGKELETLKGPQKPPRIDRWYKWIERQEKTVEQLREQKGKKAKINKIEEMIEAKKEELRKFGEDV